MTGQRMIETHYPRKAVAPAEILATAGPADQVVAAARTVSGSGEVGEPERSPDGRWARIAAVLAHAPARRRGTGHGRYGGGRAARRLSAAAAAESAASKGQHVRHLVVAGQRQVVDVRAVRDAGPRQCHRAGGEPGPQCAARLRSGTDWLFAALDHVTPESAVCRSASASPNRSPGYGPIKV